jgi:ATP/maltotriose-dependent transcriptional regulator MalT
MFMQAYPILQTKLYIPPIRPELVSRPRLIERLNEGLRPSQRFGRKLTLISAPAGFGKTTLVSEWVQAIGRAAPPIAALGGATPSIAIAWLSLDEGDNDPTHFLSYLIAALRTIEANIGKGVLSALQSPQPPPTEAVLISLINEAAANPDSIILVLDDYYVIDSKPVDAALTFLLDHVPPQMHLVIATREDPNLPLARYRAQGQLTELRADDLRFTPAETAEFLNRVMGLNLSAEDTVALASCTEGWIAGLQLAALSMQGLRDTAEFIQSFTGSHRFVLDYLLEEVLHKQPESIQDFLLRTSILDRLCGPLCDAVLLDASASGQETLEYLERANLFIIPLDNERRWYRYHHLFAELLRNRLARTMSAHLVELRRRASDWYARNDLPNEGITQALAIQDWPRAAEIIERYADQWPMRGEIGTLLHRLESFPAEILRERSGLGLQYAWALFMANQLDRAEQHLSQLMPLVQTTPSQLGEVFAIRVMIAANRGDMPAVVDLAQQALSLVPAEEPSPRSRIWLSLGVAYDEMGGDIAAAKSAFREAFELGKRLAPGSSVGNAPLPLTTLAYLSEIEWRQGNLRGASCMYERALELAEQWGGQSSIALCFVHWGRASLLYEWNDLDGAARALQQSVRIGELWKNPRLLVDAYGLSAMVMQARGQVDDARAVIRRAEQITQDWYSSLSILGSLALYQLVLWTAQNDFQAITQWEQQHDSGWQAQTGRARDRLAIALARVRIARYYRQHDESALSQANAIIEPALEQAQASGLRFNLVRLLILHALALYAQGETTPAITALKRALALAEPENYVRTFLDLGKPMEELLLWTLQGQALSEPHLRVYAGRLLSQFGAGFPIQSSQPTGDTLVEPLTERELEVLRLIAQGLSNREIGDRLFLALSTVKGHNGIIFGKLQVQRRTEAVARARELGLL